MGWIKNLRPGNAGGVGNTLEDLLGIKENNLPIPNSAEWELKCQRLNTTSLTTLFHMEPSPRALRFVPQILLLKYGWPHKEAGIKYPNNEMSFRQTIGGKNRSDRGFKICIDREEEKIPGPVRQSLPARRSTGTWPTPRRRKTPKPVRTSTSAR